MARLDWALLCDVAYLDRFDRLCIVGITRQLPAPALPLALPQLMLVARLADLAEVERLEVSVAVMTPSGGFLISDADANNLSIEMAQEYVLVTFRELPLTEEGLYSFRLQLGERSAIAVDIPVLDTGRRHSATVH